MDGRAKVIMSVVECNANILLICELFLLLWDIKTDLASAQHPQLMSVGVTFPLCVPNQRNEIASAKQQGVKTPLTSVIA